MPIKMPDHQHETQPREQPVPQIEYRVEQVRMRFAQDVDDGMAIWLRRFDTASEALRFEDCQRYVKLLRDDSLDIPLPLRAKGAQSHATMYLRRGDVELALRKYFRCLDIYKSTENTLDIGRVLCDIATIHIRREEWVQAEAELTQALSYLEGHDTRAAAAILNNLSLIASNRREHEKALRYAEQAAAYLRDLNSTDWARAQINIGLNHAHIGNFYEARCALLGSLRVFRSTNARHDMPHILYAFGKLHRLTGRTPAAKTAYEACINWARSQNDLNSLAEGLTGMAHVLRDQSRPEDAIPLYSEVILLCQDLNQLEHEVFAHRNLIICCRRIGDEARELEALERAAPRLKLFGDVELAVRMFERIQEIHLAAGRQVEADKALKAISATEGS